MSAEQPPAVAALARVVVLTREGCHLCDEAVATVQAVTADPPTPWRAVDVDADPELRARFTDHVPVTYVDGALLSYWFLDAEGLRDALAG